MIEILRADEMGFCMGVRRAVEIIEDEASPTRPIASLGEIVHNPRVVAQLRNAGVEELPGSDEILSDIGLASAERAVGGRIAITAHGVSERALLDLEATGLEVIDTTCPIVTRAQRFAQKLVREGWHVILFGDPGHKEVRGVVGWAMDPEGRSRATVVERADLEHLRTLISNWPGGFPSKVGVMAQTTHKMEDFACFVANLMQLQRDSNFEMHLVNTLCHATTSQQAAAAELARAVDVMIVVGGRKSANTRHQREVCEAQGTPTHQVEGAAELDPAWMRGASRVGLTAGASTPDISIDEVEARLAALTATG